MNKKIGILGMSEDSTQLYLKLAREQKVNLPVFPTDFERLNNLLPRPSEELKQLLLLYLKPIKNITHLLVPNITIHETLDELFTTTELPFSLLHPVQLTIKALQIETIHEVVIFGSSYTMQEGYLTNALKEHKIHCTFPDPKEKEFIDNCRKLIYQRKASASIIKRLNKLMNKYAAYTTVVIACTELSIVLDHQNTKVFDMARIQVQACC
ncbi:MAG: hypothetical protein N4A35_03060 [Flavobacteriales bacterium]|jgi:aspartate racemase|nr:hypothetical protein [Flavobacteriales bacterium]